MFKFLNKKKFKINLSWLVFDKLFRATLNLLLTILLARILGPEKYGILSYLLAFIFLFTAISSLGINPLVTNKVIKKPKNFSGIILNSYYLRIISSIISYIIFLILIYFLSNKNLYYEYAIIIGFIIVFRCGEVLFSYFEAKSLSKFIVLSQSIGLIISLITIIFILVNNLDFKYIFYAFLAESIIIFLLINFFYFSITNTKIIFFSINESKKIILKSLPILLSVVSIILYMRIDQIMIQNMLGEYSLGIYSVSVRFIEIFHFIPKIIIISYLPILLLSKKYKFKLLKLNAFIFKISLLVVLLILLSSDFLIVRIFGQEYIESSITTKILSFSIIFVFYGVVNEHWYISNNSQKYYGVYVFLGALSNVFLNFIFITKFGINGAALSTLLTYILIIFCFDNFNKKTKEIFNVKLKSIITK